MNLFMPAERVLYDRAYYLSDEAEKDYAFEVAEEHGVDVGVMTDFGELIATPFAGGISVDINLPDGKGSGQLAFIEAAPAELQDDYPTPVHVFTYDGRDSEPVHRTDVHLDGDAMTLDPVKGTPAHNGAQAHDGDSRPADLAKAASAAANRTAGSHADEAGGIKH